MQDKRNQKDRDIEQGSTFRFPPWLITYSDLITLLLTFFVLLMSMADLDPVRFNQASNSLKGAFGIRPDQSDSTRVPPITHSPPIIQTDHQIESHIINTLHRKLQHEIEDQGLDQETHITRNGSDVIRVRIQEALLFDPGDSQLKSDSIALLDRIADGIDDHPIELHVQGHSDTIESGVESDAAWELSTARAVSVLRYFVSNNLLSPSRLSAAGYGATQPLNGGNDSAARLLNRRVDIILRAKMLSGTSSADDNRGDVPL